MHNARNNPLNTCDLRINDFNPDTVASCKCLELLARWIPVCQDIADECAVDLPDADRLRLIILAAHKAMCLLASVSLTFPDPIVQNRIVNQFLIDCFVSGWWEVTLACSDRDAMMLVGTDSAFAGGLGSGLYGVTNACIRVSNHCTDQRLGLKMHGAEMTWKQISDGSIAGFSGALRGLLG